MISRGPCRFRQAEVKLIKQALMVALVCMALGGCHLLVAPPPSTGYLPADAFNATAVGQDPDLAAVQEAMIAFAYPARMYGRPAEMALAVASLDAMAGQFSTRGRWAGATSSQEMLDARTEVRGILGVPENAPSQSVIDQLMAAYRALNNGDQKAALAALSGPDFTKTPAQTLAILSRFPSAPTANMATIDAESDFFPQDPTW
jgi:hypothetical protein